jgi:hypothetical protein
VVAHMELISHPYVQNSASFHHSFRSDSNISNPFPNLLIQP